MLKQDAMTPLYVQLMDTVEKDIKSGRYKPGDKIMTGIRDGKDVWCQSDHREKSNRFPHGKRTCCSETGKGNVRNKAKIFQKYQTSPELQ